MALPASCWRMSSSWGEILVPTPKLCHLASSVVPAASSPPSVATPFAPSSPGAQQGGEDPPGLAWRLITSLPVSQTICLHCHLHNLPPSVCGLQHPLCQPAKQPDETWVAPQQSNLGRCHPVLLPVCPAVSDSWLGERQGERSRQEPPPFCPLIQISCSPSFWSQDTFYTLKLDQKHSRAFVYENHISLFIIILLESKAENNFKI